MSDNEEDPPRQMPYPRPITGGFFAMRADGTASEVRFQSGPPPHDFWVWTSASLKVGSLERPFRRYKDLWQVTFDVNDLDDLGNAAWKAGYEEGLRMGLGRPLARTEEVEIELAPKWLFDIRPPLARAIAILLMGAGALMWFGIAIILMF